jgi:hypothetical protein
VHFVAGNSNKLPKKLGFKGKTSRAFNVYTLPKKFNLKILKM